MASRENRFDRRFLGPFGVLAIVLACSFGNAPATAEEDPPKTAQIEAEQQAAIATAEKVAKTGPDSITLLDEAVLSLPAGDIFVPQPEAARYLKAFGGGNDQYLVGIIVATVGDRTIPGTLQYTAVGYVKDDDAKAWDTDALLKPLQEAMEADNDERVAHGVAPQEMPGWYEPPHYDSSTHRLRVATRVREKGNPSDKGSVTFSNCFLGRDGYFCLNMIADAEDASLAAAKAGVTQIVDAIAFIDGKKYSDFNPSTDRVAAFGVAALVGGLAAKKLGLLAAVGVFLLKIWKFILIGLAAAGITARKIVAALFRKKPPEAQA